MGSLNGGAGLLLRWALVGAVVLGLLAGWAWLRFGSAKWALACLRGEMLVLDPGTIDLGPCRDGETRAVQFRVRNLSSRPVRLLGATATCRCIAAPNVGFPIEIGPGEALDLPVEVHVSLPTAEYSQEVQFYADLSGCRPLVGSVLGHGEARNQTQGEGRDAAHQEALIER